MAHRADAADARRYGGHLVERPPFGELFEAAHLGDVEIGVGDTAGVVEIDIDLGVAFDARNGIDGDLLHGCSPWLHGRTESGPSDRQDRVRDIRIGVLECSEITLVERKKIAHGVSRGEAARFTKPRHGAKDRGSAVFRPLPGALGHTSHPHGSRHGLLSFALRAGKAPRVFATHGFPRVPSESAIALLPRPAFGTTAAVLGSVFLAKSHLPC